MTVKDIVLKCSSNKEYPYLLLGQDEYALIEAAIKNKTYEVDRLICQVNKQNYFSLGQIELFVDGNMIKAGIRAMDKKYYKIVGDHAVFECTKPRSPKWFTEL